MKRIALIITIIAAAACTGVQGLGTWTLSQEGSAKKYTVQVPCTVAGALNEAGAFGPGVLEQDRYKSIDTAQFSTPWVFSTRFNAPTGQHSILRFNGLGYSADITLNGTLIASADTTLGVFAVREFDISSIARKINDLQVKVYRAPKQSLNTGYVDWNPRPVDESMGILQKVELISTPDVRVKDIFVKPLVDPSDLGKASLDIEVTLQNLSDESVSGSLSGVFESGSFCEPVTLDAGQTSVVSVRQEVVNPRIWWTREMGFPELYRLTASFVVDDMVSHSKSVRFGIRSIESCIDSYGHRLFILNGRPLLLKAGGWTDDIFQQDTPERIRRQVEMTADMGLNCIRFENIWGKDDTVYDACDSLGILALVGFSCQWEWNGYCGLPEKWGFGCINGPEYEDLAVRYFGDQVTRLRNHASVIGWLTGSDWIPNPSLEKRYLELYEKLDYRPYVCSAKGITSTVSGPSGTKMAGPYEYVGPDYWYRDTRNGGAYGFNTETSAGMSLPQLESLVRTVGEEHLWPADSVWNFHCTASTTDMNSPRAALEAATGVYGAPGGIQDFVRKAHALDYDATRAMFEAFRCNVPHTTGIVQWMLNSAWPSMYWQLYDWYLVPTAGYYGAKKACRPLQLVFNYADGSVWGVNDALEDTSLEAVMRIYGPDSQLIDTRTKTCPLAFREPFKVFSGIKGPCFVSLELRDEAGAKVADNFYCIPEKNNVYDWEHPDWYVTRITEYSDLGFVSALPQANVSMSVESTGDGLQVTVSNESDVIAYQNILKAFGPDGRLVPAALWSDNFFSLLPGESRTLSCRTPEGSGEVTVKLDGWNLADQ